MKELTLLEQEFLENPVREIVLFILILLGGLLLRKVIALVVSRYAYLFVKKFSHNQFADEFVQLVKKPIEQVLVLLILYLSFIHLKFPDSWAMAGETTVGVRWFILVLYKIAVLVVVTRILIRSGDFIALVVHKNNEEDISWELVVFLKELVKVLIITTSIFAGLRFIFNVNIMSLIATLGIGGLAVALAAQDTLANLLGSFIIYLDRPFKQGDIVEFGDTSGTVEHVGFRTTRIRTFNRSLLIVPNKKIVDSILNNITSSTMRRVRFEIGLTYSTTAEQIRAITSEIENCIKNNDETSDDFVVKFSNYGDSSLNILVSFFVYGNEYETMIAVKEKINLAIMEIVKRNGADFAFPTTTVYLQK